MALVTAKVEFSQDDLSDTTPSWTDITTYVRDLTYWSGKTSDLDPLQAGGATIVLNNSDRRFEPDYSAGAYSPNIKPMRRFRLTMTADGTAHTQGIYYASSWGVGYPARTNYSETTVQCVDGCGILSLDTLPTLTPPDAASYADVILADDPWGYWPLDEESGGAMNAAVGISGAYRGLITHTKPNPVVGDNGFAISSGGSGTPGYGRAKLTDDNVWVDSIQVSCEGVVENCSGSDAVVLGPFRTTTTNDYIFALTCGLAWVYPTASTVVSASGGGGFTASRHHVAMTWDGSTLSYYQDGVLSATSTGAGLAPVAPDSGDFIRIGGNGVPLSWAFNGSISHVAVYNYALTSSQVAAHADAALNLGYAEQTTGDRVADLATNALWSTAGITGGQVISVASRMQVGQSRLEEIQQVAQAEQPFGLFYFDDSGNPAYQGADAAMSSAATFSDSASDVLYEDIQLVYDDDLYNDVTIAREGGEAQTHTDTSSQSAYMTRGYNQTGLILATDADADLVAAGICDGFANPRIRVASIRLNSATQTARNQMLTREIGDTIRVKRRTDTGEAIDVTCRILGKTKHIGPDGNLTCTWTLSRGVDSSDAHWHLGVTGFSELNSTTILA